jgi:hypothetical protein
MKTTKIKMNWYKLAQGVGEERIRERVEFYLNQARPYEIHEYIKEFQHMLEDPNHMVRRDYFYDWTKEDIVKLINLLQSHSGHPITSVQ